MSSGGAKSRTRVKYCLKDEDMLRAGTGGKGRSRGEAVADWMMWIGAFMDAEY